MSNILDALRAAMDVCGSVECVNENNAVLARRFLAWGEAVINEAPRPESAGAILWDMRRRVGCDILNPRHRRMWPEDWALLAAHAAVKAVSYASRRERQYHDAAENEAGYALGRALVAAYYIHHPASLRSARELKHLPPAEEMGTEHVTRYSDVLRRLSTNPQFIEASKPHGLYEADPPAALAIPFITEASCGNPAATIAADAARAADAAETDAAWAAYDAMVAIEQAAIMTSADDGDDGCEDWCAHCGMLCLRQAAEELAASATAKESGHEGRGSNAREVG